MSKYIKSHSNYVLKKKHQNINGGIVYERDMTTIGGLDQFAKGQVPIYKSSNFIITVNNEHSPSRDFANNGWKVDGNNDSGVWRLSDMTDITSSTNDSSSNIVLKQDYYKLKDFAYYGSCVELIRASITDIIKRFPGELYVPKVNNNGIPVYYTVQGKNEQYRLGGTKNLVLVDNPHEINIHTSDINEKDVENPLKYVCLSYKKYGLDKKQTVTKYDCEVKNVGSHIATVDLKGIEIYVYVGNEGKIVYLTSNGNAGTSIIKPIEECLNEFYNTLDNFQKVILNPNTEPKYTAEFEVLKENSFGYETEIKKFTFPTTYGGYNLSYDNAAYNSYINGLISYAEFYDDVFCDNLWRSMTHESIKNFDWTYTRDYSNGEEDEYVLGGTKMQKLIRLFGREFDEIKTYIDGIKGYNQITYGSDCLLPDYFLTDVLESEGWDMENIFPFNNNLKQVTSIDDIKPYSYEHTEKDYFININSKQLIDNSIERFFIDDCDDLKPRISRFSSEKVYSINEVNNHFMKMLKMNSRAILNKKGTIEGIESLLSLFGLKSKRWFESMFQDDYRTKQKLSNSEDVETYLDYDYNIIEYVTATKPEIDEYKEEIGMHEYDWYNSTKTIVYDTIDYRNGIYNSYQGLPLRFYYEIDGKMYRSDSLPLDEKGDIIDVSKKERYLYPYFSNDMLIDGNPYYQMYGGWLKKKPYMFDKDNNIVSGDSRQLYTETFRDIKTVKNIQELISLPKTSLNVNDVYYVVDLKSKDYAIVDGVVYDILEDENGYKYISVYTRSGIVTIGKTTFVSEVTVSSPYSSSNLNNYEVHLLDDYQNNTEIRIYILGYDDSPQIYAFGKYYSINNFILLKNGTYNGGNLIEDNGIMTHYFQLEDIDNKTNIGGGGWIQLSKDSQAYYLINTIFDKYNGNNPHSGHLKYDNGYTYLSYFSKLFKYAVENNEFNEKCYDGDFIEKLDEIKNIGFKYICLDDCEYNEYSDTKVHYLGKIIKDNGEKEEIDLKYEYALKDENGEILKDENGKIIYKLAKINDVGFFEEENIEDNVSDIIINTKRMDINFYLLPPIKSKESKETEEERKERLENIKYKIKYYDYIVMNYLSQMIPHNMIVTINYCQDKEHEC